MEDKVGMPMWCPKCGLSFESSAVRFGGKNTNVTFSGTIQEPCPRCGYNHPEHPKGTFDFNVEGGAVLEIIRRSANPEDTVAQMHETVMRALQERSVKLLSESQALQDLLNKKGVNPSDDKNFWEALKKIGTVLGIISFLMTSGVVPTISDIKKEARKRGHKVDVRQRGDAPGQPRKGASPPSASLPRVDSSGIPFGKTKVKCAECYCLVALEEGEGKVRLIGEAEINEEKSTPTLLYVRCPECPNDVPTRTKIVRE